MVGFAPPKVNQASALGVLMLVITVTLVLIQYRVLGDRSFVTVSGKGLRPDLVALGAARWPLALLGFGYILFVVLMPYAALLFIALRKNLFYATLGAMADPTQLSLDQFVLAFGDPVVRASFVNSLLVSLGTVAIGSVLYFTIAYVVQRTTLKGRRALDLIAILPIAIPGLIIGLGYLWTWISLPIGIYGTLWIIILAYVSQFSPQGVRAISGSLVQIDPELEESSRLCGAGLLPHLAPHRHSARLARHPFRHDPLADPVVSRACDRALPLHLDHAGVLAHHVRLLAARLDQSRRRDGACADARARAPRAARAPHPARAHPIHSPEETIMSTMTKDVVEHEAPHLFIGGEWSAPHSGRTIASIDPSTEKVWAHVAEADETDVDRAVARGARRLARTLDHERSPRASAAPCS